MVARSGAPDSPSGLALSFSASGRDHEHSTLGNYYTAAIVDHEDSEILTLKLPAELVERAVLARCEVDVFVSLTGNVSTNVEIASLGETRPERQGLDDLVARAVEPAMLQDEPEADEMLRSLRQKLKTAIDAVDTALSRIATR
jgi:hypothetical protein